MKDIAASGIIGEQHNALTGFMVNVSRKREKPLLVMYLGVSGSGKTHLQEGLAALIPEEDRIEATGLSDQSLYYEGLKLKGKILFIERPGRGGKRHVHHPGAAEQRQDQQTGSLAR